MRGWPLYRPATHLHVFCSVSVLHKKDIRKVDLAEDPLEFHDPIGVFRRKTGYMNDIIPDIDYLLTGQNIHQLRTERGIKVQEIVSLLNLSSPRTVYKWQNGVCLPTVEHLLALSFIFKVPMDEIIVVKNFNND